MIALSKWQACFILIFLVFLVTGCASRFFIPTNRFLSPETDGALWKGEVKLGSAGVTQVQLADSMTSTTPDITPILSRNSSIYFGAELGLASWLDVYYSGVASAPGFVGLKIQIIGDPASTAKAGNFSIALAGGPGFGSAEQTDGSDDLKGKTKMKFTGWETALLLGLRLSDSFLIYAGPFKTHVQTNTEIQRTQNSVTTTTAEPHGTGDISGINLGLRFGKSIFLNIEGSYTTNQWTRTNPTELKADDLNALTGGVAVGGAW